MRVVGRWARERSERDGRTARESAARDGRTVRESAVRESAAKETAAERHIQFEPRAASAKLSAVRSRDSSAPFGSFLESWR